MTSKTQILIKVMLLLLVGSFGYGCSLLKSDSKVRRLGPDVKADLLVYFRVGASREEIDRLSNQILYRPRADGRGADLAEGVGKLLRIPTVEGHEGIAITFLPNSTREQRSAVHDAFKASSVVYKILENTVPTDVKRLD